MNTDPKHGLIKYLRAYSGENYPQQLTARPQSRDFPLSRLDTRGSPCGKAALLLLLLLLQLLLLAAAAAEGSGHKDGTSHPRF